MINYLHSRIYRPEKGWDPVPLEHVEKYSAGEWAAGVAEEILDRLEVWTGGLRGIRVLDFGGGPGHYSVAFAQRGADVTWFDVSRNYKRLAEEKVSEAGVSARFVLGYLDDAPRLLGETFDLVFNRVCWNYGRGDRAFAKVLYSLVRPGGVGYIDTTHSYWQREALPAAARGRTWLNDRLSLKIGHPFPPPGRLAKLFVSAAIKKLLIDYSSPHNDRITFIKAEPSE